MADRLTDTLQRAAARANQAIDGAKTKLAVEPSGGRALSSAEQLDRYLTRADEARVNQLADAGFPGEVERYHQYHENLYKEMMGAPLKRRPF